MYFKTLKLIKKHINKNENPKKILKNNTATLILIFKNWAFSYIKICPKIIQNGHSSAKIIITKIST